MANPRLLCYKKHLCQILSNPEGAQVSQSNNHRRKIFILRPESIAAAMRILFPIQLCCISFISRVNDNISCDYLIITEQNIIIQKKG